MRHLITLSQWLDLALCCLSPVCHARWRAGWRLDRGTWCSPYCDHTSGRPLTEREWLIEGYPMPEEPGYAEWEDAATHYERLDCEADHCHNETTCTATHV